jgi:hypothetical protein
MLQQSTGNYYVMHDTYFFVSSFKEQILLQASTACYGDNFLLYFFYLIILLTSENIHSE